MTGHREACQEQGEEWMAGGEVGRKRGEGRDRQKGERDERGGSGKLEECS